MERNFDLEELLGYKGLSPLIKQYIEFKLKYNDCVLLSHVGDFWEMYLNDAQDVGMRIGLKISSKACGLDFGIPMCGFPYNKGTSSNTMINRILSLGLKIALCEQLEDPKNMEGKIVKRDVVQIITPGTIIDEDLLQSSNNFLASIVKNDDMVGFSYVDVSTGELFATSFNSTITNEELSRVKPTELIMEDFDMEEELQATINNYRIFVNKIDHVSEDILELTFDLGYLDGLKLDALTRQSLIQLLSYIMYTQKKVPNNINSIELYNVSKTMLLDSFTRDSLELTKQMKSNSINGSLFSIMDKTKTAMGRRLLKQRIEQPFINKEFIEEQLDLVEDFVNNGIVKDEVNDLLSNIRDIERICGRIAFERATPPELVMLKKSLEVIPQIIDEINNSNCEHLKNFITNMDDLYDLYDLIDNGIEEEPCNSPLEGYVIKSSYNEMVAKYRNILANQEILTVKIIDDEKKRLETNGGKFGKNDLDGYYIEFTKKVLKTIKIPDEYRKVKELSNSYRYTFPKLRDFEIETLEAQDKLRKVENDLFVDIRTTLSKNISRIKRTARLLAKLDLYLSLGKLAIENNYVKPSLNEEHTTVIKNGRHPIVEILNTQFFVSNDIVMDDSNDIHVITGPNMSGKSTYMRQVALIILMAQMGSFVPCEMANISICDRIFTRIGASDNLANGESTFMVEMNELSQILNNATSKSFILLDEVGRGTSTFDGISIAKATIEYISKNIKCHTLFSTHYFELVSLERYLPNVKNYKIDVKENNDGLVFLRKVIRGNSTKSYGIHIAKMVNLPNELIDRAKEILDEFEKNKEALDMKDEPLLQEKVVEEKPKPLSIKEPIIEEPLAKEDTGEKEIVPIQTTIPSNNNGLEMEIRDLDLMNMTPMDTFLYVYNLQKKLKQKNKMT
jgi:DNA mismatch repair protein MutS